MIGIRVLQLRKISKELSKSNFTSFLKCDYCGCFEELLIRGILLSYIKDYDGPGGLKGAVESNSEMQLISLEVTDKGVILDNDTKEDLERLFRWHERKK